EAEDGDFLAGHIMPSELGQEDFPVVLKLPGVPGGNAEDQQIIFEHLLRGSRADVENFHQRRVFFIEFRLDFVGDVLGVPGTTAVKEADFCHVCYLLSVGNSMNEMPSIFSRTGSIE